MHQTPVIDLAFSLHYVPLLADERKVTKYLNRLQDTIELTNPALMQDIYN